jgi:hypothetical protein
MPPIDNWTDEERRRILERRRQARQEERDRQAEEAERAGIPIPKQKVERRRTVAEPRHEQICFVCRGEYVPTASGQTVCPACQIDGVRGAGQRGRRNPRF